MNAEDVKQIETGDIIRNIGSGNVYVVTENNGDTLVAVRTVTVMNPSEWEYIPKYSTRDERHKDEN